MATKGFGSPDVGQTYERARHLCEQLGETPQLFSVLRGLWAFYNVQADFRTARTLSEQLLRLAQQSHDPVLVQQAYEAMAGTAQFCGEFTHGRASCEQVVALYDPLQHGAQSFRYGYDAGLGSLGRLTCFLWFLGYPDQATRVADKLLTLAQASPHVQSKVIALHQAAFHHQYRQEAKQMQERAEATMALSNEHGLLFSLAIGTFQLGWALAAQGQITEGVAQLRQGLLTAQTTGGRSGRSYQLSLLVDALRRAGEPEEGLQLIAEALAHVNNTGERFSEAELYRLKGELTLQKLSVVSSQLSVTNSRSLTPYPQSEAEACFLKALEISQKQHAKSLELRASVSLARLWQQQGKTTEAHQMLSAIYNWFTEGFETKDLHEARALLEELADR
jgi:predicted ATPase